MPAASPTIWIDVDNPPQVQYLLPFADAFRERGAGVVVTARAYGNAVELLEQRSSPFVDADPTRSCAPRDPLRSRLVAWASLRS